MNLRNPFHLQVREDGILEGYDEHSIKKVKDMLVCYNLSEIERDALEVDSEQAMYEVYKKNVSNERGRLLQCTTIIYPGHINKHFFMTRGHRHVDTNCDEIYHGVSGEGILLLQRGDEFKYIYIKKGVSAYIPGDWAHRTVTTSLESPFIFYSIWPADSGYDYEYVKNNPFGKNVVLDEKNGFVIQ